MYLEFEQKYGAAKNLKIEVILSRQHYKYVDWEIEALVWDRLESLFYKLGNTANHVYWKLRPLGLSRETN